MAGIKLSQRQEHLLWQAASGAVKHQNFASFETWWAPNERGYAHRVHRTAQSLLGAGLIERGTTPLGRAERPYFKARVTGAGWALLAERTGVE